MAEEWLNEINRRGLAVATRLAELKAGKDVTLSGLGTHEGLADVWAKREKEEALRRVLDEINRARENYVNDTLHICSVCHEQRNELEINEFSWRTSCGKCWDRYKKAKRE